MVFSDLPTTYYLSKKHFRSKDAYQLKGLKKDISYNSNQNTGAVKNCYKRQRSMPYNDKRVNSPRRYEKCISAPNFRAPKLIRQMLEELNGEIHNIMNNE